ncbi:MAG: Lrp/AsnC family transcriptional regulator, partial [Neomegalonema sp.]
MSAVLDDLDRKILAELQADSSRSLDDIARLVGASKTPVWNRIRKMREAGVIKRQMTLLDPEALGIKK